MGYDPNISLNCMTQTTSDMFNDHKPPRVNMTNRKPFRTKVQKEEARKTATKREDGAWRSNAPVSYHREIQLGRSA